MKITPPAGYEQIAPLQKHHRVSLPASGAVNLIGDNNNPAVDQNDNFVVVGRDVDGNPLDGGYQEFTVSINGSAPILVNGAQRLNVLGDDAAQ